jgi:hypothetical protein
MSLPMTSLIRPVAAAFLAAVVAGCATDAVTSVRPPSEGTFVVDARTAWQYVNLGDSAQVVPTNPNASAAWDIAFYATNITLNGGAAGPGGVTAACLCRNAAASGDEVLAMTPETEAEDFDTLATVPAGLNWMSEALTPAIVEWHTGSGASAAADPTRTYLVRLRDSLSYAKVRVVGLAAPTATSPAAVTLEFAVQASAAGALGAAQTLEVDLSTPGIKRVDLAAGAVTTSETAWDLALEGFDIRVNGGVSGPGKGGAALATTAFDETTTAVTAANAYRTDVYAGVFAAHRYYRYNIAGDHRISPTFDVYLVRRGSATYKLQVTGYYNGTGEARHIAFRWKRID